jgi:hypothetical protein
MHQQGAMENTEKKRNCGPDDNNGCCDVCDPSEPFAREYSAVEAQEG